MSNTPNTQPDSEPLAESSDTDSDTESLSNSTAEPSSQDPELAAQVDLLAAENRRLREMVAAAQRSRYRGTAIALCGVGLLCGLLGYFIPAGSTVLFALAGTGVFGGVLTYFLTPERFISADVGQRVYTASAESFERLCSDLGLSDRRVYVPAASDSEEHQSESVDSWLFVPQDQETPIPESTKLDSALVVDDDERGLSVRPTGSGLFSAVTTSLTEPLGSTAEPLCAQLSDALVEDFELAQSIEYDIDPADGRVSFRILGALYGDGSRFDHPIVSLLAVGLATGLETPVETTITATDPLSVTLRWESTAVDEDGISESS